MIGQEIVCGCCFVCRCVFEIYIAIDMEECKLDVIMPPSERVTFNEALTKQFGKIFEALSKVDLRNAQVEHFKSFFLSVVLCKLFICVSTVLLLVPVCSRPVQRWVLQANACCCCFTLRCCPSNCAVVLLSLFQHLSTVKCLMFVKRLISGCSTLRRRFNPTRRRSLAGSITCSTRSTRLWSPQSGRVDKCKHVMLMYSK